MSFLTFSHAIAFAAGFGAAVVLVAVAVVAVGNYARMEEERLGLHDRAPHL